MRPPRPLIPRLAFCAAWLLAAVLVALPWAAPARASEAGDRERALEPRLILPGAHAVRAGQLVALRWSPADSIRELEILVSVDGGRSFLRCISPSLDPGRREFVWRVPDLGSPSVWLRIRFNRGGREIEGAPTAPLTVLAGGSDDPEPLALPPLDAAPARPAGERQPAPLGSTAPRPDPTLEPPRADRAAAVGRMAHAAAPARQRPAAGARHTALTAPRFLPLRT